MHFSMNRWSFTLMWVICLAVLLGGCKGEEKVSEPAPESKVVAMKTMDPAGLCPQTRGTSPAPEPYTGMTNLLPASEENLAAGKQLFHQDVQPIPCETCHGFKGNGFGVIFAQMQPYPRDFTCYQTMKEVSDGQLFWIIKHGSHGTRMKPFKNLKEDEIWQLAHYVRHFSE
ncbi:MAG: c-type cytochrome [Nitrospinota bacterium]|nr:c-type cytochrome [Nitrospinota bacterium]